MSKFQDDRINPDVIPILDELPFWSAAFGLRLLEVVRCKRNMKALDIGCGLGFPMLELSMRLGNSSKVFGIDPSRAAIERLRQKIGKYKMANVEAIEGFAEKMPFERNYFDLIVSNNGINNVNDIEQTFSECRRVSKSGAQFAFTFNTDRTFSEFYDVYHGVLSECGLKECQKKLSEHIYSKRRPVSEFKEQLKKHGFRKISVHNNAFRYRFVDATSMFNHFFIKLAFMPSWKAIIPRDRQQEVFHKIEMKLNSTAKKSGCLTMQVPFVTIDCEVEK